MGLTHRPYIGTWQPDGLEVVQHSPDAIVHINGSTKVPGCHSCDSYIDVQKYITSVTVDAGIEPTGASASISLSIPRHSADSFCQDANYILRPGLEVHVFMKGYFPIQGQYSDVRPEETGGVDISRTITYPYYQVFHGVITDVNFSYSGGFRDATLSCASMLHFWSYQNMSTNGAYFGARPANSGITPSLVGGRFNSWTPHSIVYYLYSDSIGNAADVNFALSDRTSVNAKNDYLNKSLYSLSIEYWKKRFKNGAINLRMHGASGEVLSTPQMIYLSKLSGTRIRTLLNSLYGGGGQKNDIMSESRSLGLFQKVVDPISNTERYYNPVTMLDSVYTSDGNVRGSEFNIADVHAFVQGVGQYGDIAIFETTYESKLDVLGKVLDVTGWEFYQDVDGDFVFKPPMYNLDTRENRCYVMKAVDIISINTVEKEPQYTYVTTNNNHFKNLSDMGCEGIFGVRGQYMDYKLIAQYGWRPYSFETSYFTNKNALFYNAMNRLDIINIDMNSASVSIPLRPELRPGYPVYIEPYDCFYYVQSMSHSMTYGGACTTDLTLVAKRSKFFAPGEPGMGGIESINLGVSTLPEKPLQILDNDGHPRLSGFPNVVMALDPEAINPLYFAAGFQFSNLNDEKAVKNIFDYAVSSGLLMVDDGKYSFNKNSEKYSAAPSHVKTTVTIGEVSSVSAEVSDASRTSSEIDDYKKKRKENIDKIDLIDIEISKALPGNVADDNTEIKETSDSRVNRLNTEKTKLENEIKEYENKIAALEGAFNQALRDDPVLGFVYYVLEIIMDSAGINQNDIKLSSYLDILSEKKSMFSNNRPGHYRYYSSSHPDPKHQGQNNIKQNLTDAESSTRVDRRVFGYLPNVESSPIGFTPESLTGKRIPEASMGEIEVKRGFNVASIGRGNSELTTDQIYTMMFAKHSVNVEKWQSIEDDRITHSGSNIPTTQEISDSIFVEGRTLNEIIDEVSSRYNVKPEVDIKVEGERIPDDVKIEDIAEQSGLDIENLAGAIKSSMIRGVVSSLSKLGADAPDGKDGSVTQQPEPQSSVSAREVVGEVVDQRSDDHSGTMITRNISWNMMMSGYKKIYPIDGLTVAQIEDNLIRLAEEVEKIWSGIKQAFPGKATHLYTANPGVYDPLSSNGGHRTNRGTQHARGRAIDIKIGGMETLEEIMAVGDAIIEMMRGGKIFHGVVGFYYASDGSRFIHYDMRRGSRFEASWGGSGPEADRNLAEFNRQDRLRDARSRDIVRFELKQEDGGILDTHRGGGYTGRQSASSERVSRSTSGRSSRSSRSRSRNTGKREESFPAEFYSPIFPVSDRGGYRLIGNYRYGRDMDISGLMTLRSMAKEDVLKFADPKDVEIFLNSLSNPDKKLVGRMYRAIKSNPSVGSYVDNLDENSDDFVSKFKGLVNLPTNTTAFTEKVYISNVARFLSDITPMDSETCTCRSIQADIFTEAFSAENFLQIVPTELDKLSKFQSSLSVEQGIKWKRFKDAISGTMLDYGRANVAEESRRLIEGTPNFIDGLGKNLTVGFENMVESYGEISDSSDEFSRKFMVATTGSETIGKKTE